MFSIGIALRPNSFTHPVSVGCAGVGFTLSHESEPLPIAQYPKREYPLCPLNQQAISLPMSLMIQFCASRTSTRPSA